MNGHTAKINVVKFLSEALDGRQVLLSGASNGQIHVWHEVRDAPDRFSSEATVEAHGAAVSCIATLPGTTVFASGAADASFKLWKIEVQNSTLETKLFQQISLTPRYFPLAISLHPLDQGPSSILVVGGTKTSIQVFISESEEHSDFTLKATLTGHEGWVRSIDITWEDQPGKSDLLIASASQDKYIRLWRVHQGTDLPATLRDEDDTLAVSGGRALSSKAHGFVTGGLQYSLTFEALLLGHEDWVYSAKWNRKAEKLRLLSASADSSLAIWEAEATSGVWVSVTRLGEINVQKGATTATGSAGGFSTGLWINHGESVTSLGRTGSWRVWRHEATEDRWFQDSGLSGHVKEVKGLCWSQDGSYLLSTSSDQTTRLHAPWKRGKKRSWQEFARPQIHGYDLSCVDSISNTQFISGADEKLLRVFDQPRATAELLQRLSGGTGTASHKLPEVASIPVLGLSNKAIDAAESAATNPETNSGEYQLETDMAHTSLNESTESHPPFEDELSRHTLWPEREKLYGHGFEISAVAASHDGSIVATACKASSLDHAVIRLYETQSWHEIPTTLKAHSLTVTALRFSDDDKYLLSTGRDRQWAVCARDEVDRNVYGLHASDPKGHSRMILGAAWAPVAFGRVFASAGRDKQIKLWAAEDDGFKSKAVISAAAPVMSVDFHPELKNGCLVLAAGMETGQITISVIDASFAVIKSVEFGSELCPALAVSQLAWQRKSPVTSNGDYTPNEEKSSLLAVASDDCSTRILSIRD